MNEDGEKIEIHRGLKGVYFDRSQVCHIDGRAGELRYRGYSIHDLAEHCSFEEVAYLLMHCKFASQGAPRGVIADLYEVCGQAMKSVRWKSDPRDMIENLIRREKNRCAGGRPSGFLVGDAAGLLAIEDVLRQSKTSFAIGIAQPGLSKTRVSAEQLRLLASTESYIRQITSGSFEVHCSA